MSSSKLDCVIIGQGLAGTCLAWQLLWRGSRVLVIDWEDSDSASRVAAGLMTPVTGQRLVPSWWLDEFWPAALEFYRRVEAEVEASFLLEPGQVRLFASEPEHERFTKRDLAENRDWIVARASVHSDEFQNEHGGFEIPRAARLNVAAFLEASRNHLQKLGLYQTGEVDPDTDVSIAGKAVEIRRLGVASRQLVFCQGFAASKNPWFNEVRFDATRGEILTLKIPGLTETRIVNRGVWLAPLGGDLFRVGATYDWENLAAGPTEAGREELCRRLREFLKLPFEVVDHSAGIRPIVVGRHPIIGLHSEHPQLGIFNGLGSKGSLQAPLLARQLAELLLDEKSIDSEVNVATRFSTAAESKPPERPRLTALAHNAIQAAVRPGEVAIDATAGNGHDTCFLSRLVGEKGTVFALDCQAEAIERTRRRLQENGLTNVTLRQCDHAEIANVIPEQFAGQVAAVMFNLGYLPGGDKSIITRTASSVIAIRSALTLLRSGGVHTVMAYPGHDGGDEETIAVESLLNTLGRDFDVRTETVQDKESAPRLYLVRRV
ncbi:MAG: FAD-dependent oxidoreductase [Planctomycetes bacterium]|nr:FAD-dependent oxidoreductase [Planctomycetota bacterium]